MYPSQVIVWLQHQPRYAFLVVAAVWLLGSLVMFFGRKVYAGIIKRLKPKEEVEPLRSYPADIIDGLASRLYVLTCMVALQESEVSRIPLYSTIDDNQKILFRRMATATLAYLMATTFRGMELGDKEIAHRILDTAVSQFASVGANIPDNMQNSDSFLSVMNHPINVGSFRTLAHLVSEYQSQRIVEAEPERTQTDNA